MYITSEALSSSPDGWVEGTSWLTGQTGLLPESYTQRTAESDAWTLHRKVSLHQTQTTASLSRQNTAKMMKDTKNPEPEPQLPQFPTQEFLKNYADVRESRERNGEAKSVSVSLNTHNFTCL